MRLDKLLANMGFGSRKEVKALLKKAKVKVNGQILKDGKKHVDPNKDTVTVHEKEIVYREFIYLMMNKPKGVISATEDFVDQTVVDLLEGEHAMFHPFPVGRLDKDTTGLMFLTNDGKLAHFITSPKSEVEKTYLVHLNQAITEEDIAHLEEGVELDDGYVTMPATVQVVEESNDMKIRLTIKEGKFHQVKRMMESCGKRVVALKRERIGSLQLDTSLKLGEYRELEEEELKGLEMNKPKEKEPRRA